MTSGPQPGFVPLFWREMDLRANSAVVASFQRALVAAVGGEQTKLEFAHEIAPAMAGARVRMALR